MSANTSIASYASAASRPRHEALSFRIGLFVLALLLGYVLLTFGDYGLSNDEEVQHVYGRMLLDFYLSGFADRSAFAYKNLYLYGGLFDLIAATLERLLPAQDVWQMRHLLSGLFGMLGMIGAWQLARHLGGERVGLVALVLLAITGAWTGAMFTHTKDVPFAACMTWALYCTTRVVEQLPAPRRAWLIGLGISVGCALGLRVGGVFAVLYLVLACVAAAFQAKADWPERGAFLARTVAALLPAALIAFALMALFWPWSVMAPGNVYTAASTFARIDLPLDTVLAGRVYELADIPAYYLSYYLLARLPELLLLGLALAILRGIRTLGRSSPRSVSQYAACLPLILAAGFPIAFTLITAPTLYNGMRHFLFVAPPLAILAAMGLCRTWDALRPRLPRPARVALLGLAAILLLDPLVTLARLHPYEYIHYNRLIAGGMAKAVEQWEVDYWSSSLREAALRLNAYVAAEKPAPGQRYVVAVCAEPLQGEVYLDNHFHTTTDWLTADFFITALYQNHCEDALHGKVIATVSRLGIPLAIVKDRRDVLYGNRAPH